MLLYFDKRILLTIFLIVVLLTEYNFQFFFTQASGARIPKSRGGLIMNDPNLKAEVVAEGLRFPTSMAFLGPNDILVLERNNGTVQRIVDGKMMPQPLLDVSVANKGERGMLGIAVAKHNENGITYVFLSYTETKVEGSDICPKTNYCIPGHDPLGNRLYRYELVNNKLVNPKLLLDLPAVPGPAHNSGRIIIGPDNNVYYTMGDVVGYRTPTQNIPDGPNPNGTSAIYRITQDGKAVKGILSDKEPLDKYYAYGIRNSYGIDFDPVTGKLWDTENGPSFGDEINLVEPGFNSGWRKVQGMWETNGFVPRDLTTNPTGLEDFGGKGKYSPPEFVWNNTSGPTGIKFLNSDKLGKQYQNDMFVGDFHGGNIYHFKLNQTRTGLVLGGALADKIANNAEELTGITFAKGFGAVTDVQVGPDGYLYIVSYGKGIIYRIVPTSNTTAINPK